MYSRARPYLILLTCILGVLLPRPAVAWVEASVESQLMTVELARDGKALVTHELRINVRGGPLESYTLDGVDSDAEPLPDARAMEARSQDPAGIPLLATRLPEGGLKLTVTEGKGLTRGSYLLRFGYRSDFMGRGLIRAQLGHAELSWKGPRLSDGVDSAKAIFRFPRSERAPSLPSQDLERAALGLDPELAGVFVSNLVRGQRVDELEVIRLHIPGREAPLYKLWTGLDAFSEFTSVPVPAAVNPAVPAKRERFSGLLALLAGLGALGLSAAKFRESKRIAGTNGKAVETWIPCPLSLRVLLIGGLIGTSAWCVLMTQLPFLALLETLAACTLLIHRLPSEEQQLRGPGKWKPLTLRALQGLRAETTQPLYQPKGRNGRLLLAALLVGPAALIVNVPLGELERSLVGLVWLCFLVATFASAPQPLAGDTFRQRSSKELLRQAKSLLKAGGVEVQVLGRFSNKTEQLDELRLRALPERPKPGLIGVELGSVAGAGGLIQQYVLLRVLDGSLAQRALPRGLVWVRGRTSSERVAVVSPRLPVRAAVRRLLLELLALTREEQTQAPKLSQKAASSAGSGALTSKASQRVSPAKAA